VVTQIEKRRALSVPRQGAGDGEVSTKPFLRAAVVEAVHGERSRRTARSWGGQLFVLSGTNLSHY
jgi:hypothetical protein